MFLPEAFLNSNHDRDHLATAFLYEPVYPPINAFSE
jgi:hypothetical protein